MNALPSLCLDIAVFLGDILKYSFLISNMSRSQRALGNSPTQHLESAVFIYLHALPFINMRCLTVPQLASRAHTY